MTNHLTRKKQGTPMTDASPQRQYKNLKYPAGDFGNNTLYVSLKGSMGQRHNQLAKIEQQKRYQPMITPENNSYR